MGDVCDLAHLTDRDGGAATSVLCVLKADHGGARRAAADRGFYLGGVDVSSGVVRDGAEADAAECGRADAFMVEDVGFGADEGFVAATAVGEQRDEVGHGAAGYEEGGFLADSGGCGLFEGFHSWVVADHVVANDGGCHGLAHGRAGTRYGVGSEVDHVRHSRLQQVRRGGRRSVSDALISGSTSRGVPAHRMLWREISLRVRAPRAFRSPRHP